MKKIVTVEYEKASINEIDWKQRRRTIMHKFLDSYKIIGRFIAQRVCKGKKEPKKMILGIKIWRGVPTKRGIKVIIEKNSLDKLKKCQRFQVITKMFLNAYQALGEFCIERICSGKKDPEKTEVAVEVK
jgi:hypothetical protein